MYPVSPKCLDIIKGDSIVVNWAGTITMLDGSVYNFTHRNIDNGSGEINLSCSSSSEIGIGNAYLGEFVARLLDLNVDRYKIKGAVINLTAIVYSERSAINTWGDAAGVTWSDLKTVTWGELLDGASVEYSFPMGVFVVEEAMRSNNAIKITSYDNMHKLDTKLPDQMPTDKKTPYDWIKLACTTCGVSMGFTRREAFKMPNGDRLLSFANSNAEVKTWRDVVAEAAAAMGGNAMMDRNGSLIIRHYGKMSVDVVVAGGRYSSQMSDYQSYYTGIYLSYRDGGLVEYQRNTSTAADDTGLAYDLGYNVFLQISDDSARHKAMKEIIDGMKDRSYTPFSVSIPFNPAYDLMDVIEFYGNQAAKNDVGPITAITFRIGGRMNISCGGANPALQEAKTKETKAIESASSGSGYNDDFWMVMDNAPDDETVEIEADSATKISEALFYAKEELSMLQVAFTATYSLLKTALVEVEVFVDETSIYKTKENQWPGENRLTVTTGYELEGTGSHKVKVYFTVKESTLDIGGGGVLMELNLTSNGIRVAEDDGVYGYSKVTAVVTDDLAYYAQAKQQDFDALEFLSETEFDEGTHYTEAVQGQDTSILIQSAFFSDLNCTAQAAKETITNRRDLYCRISEHAGDGAQFNGRYFARTEDAPPLLFINFTSTSGYSSYGIISNHSDIPAHTGDYYGSLYAGGTLTVGGNTFYLFNMGGWWAIDRSGIAYTVNGKAVNFISNVCYLLIESDVGTIRTMDTDTENDFLSVLAEFAQMG